MSNITAAQVKKLREATDLGLMDCKRALKESDGDFDKAVTIVREKAGVKVTDKLMGRKASEGRIWKNVEKKGEYGSLIRMNCQTDFTANSDDFGDLLSYASIAYTCGDSDDLTDDLSLSNFIVGNIGETIRNIYAKNATVGSKLTELSAKVGELITIDPAVKFVTQEFEDYVGAYVHFNGKVGAIVNLGFEYEGECKIKSEKLMSLALESLANEICVHIVGCNPECVSIDDVDPQKIKTNKDFFAQELKMQKRPENKYASIIEGKMQRFYREVVLLEQRYIRDDRITISQLLETEGEKFGAKITIKEFCRLQVGE